MISSLQQIKFLVTPLIYVFTCFVIALGAMPSPFAYAASNKLFITPESSQMNIGTTFSVNVKSYAESDQSVGSVNGSVTYNSGLLQVVSISTGGSGYGSPSISQSTGSIGFSGSRNPAPSGIAQIFSIQFKAKASGTAIVGFSGSSNVNNLATGFTSGVYTITNPNPPTTVPKPSSTPKPSATPKPSPVPIVTTPTKTPEETISEGKEPVPTPDPTGLISGVSVDPSYTSATVTWTIEKSGSSATFNYGTSSTTLDKKAAAKKGENGIFTTTVTNLEPGERYFYTISGTATGTDNGTFSGTILTDGYPVTLTVTENDQPAINAQVRIGSLSRSTGQNGKLTIGLAAGSYTGTITTDTAQLNISLTVEKKEIPLDGAAPSAQGFTYKLTSSPLEQGPGSNFSILSFLGILAIGTVVLGAGFFVFMSYRRRQFEGSGSSGSYSGTSVIIEDGYNWHGDANQAPSQEYQQDPQPYAESPPVANSEEYQPSHNTLPIDSTQSQTSPEQNPNLPHSTKL